MGTRRAHTCRDVANRPGIISHTTRHRGTHRDLELRKIMKALVYGGPGRKAWKDVPTATVQENTDAVMRVDCTTICGTDLHILKGDVPEVTKGRILGHEAVGTVETIGSAVTTVSPAIGSSSRASAPVGDAVSVVRAATVSALAGAVGSLATSSTGPRLSTFGYPLPIPRRTRCPRERAMRRSSCSPTSCPHRTKLES